MSPSNPVTATALRAADAIAAGAFGAVSTLRGGRSLHPRGLAFHATLDIEPAPPGFRSARLLRRPHATRAIVRLSRSLGLPEGMPDIYGAAIRIPDAYGPGRDQDLMLVTGGENAAARHIFTFARGYEGRTMSTILPYRIGERNWVFLLRAEPDPRLPGRLHSLEAVAEAAKKRTLSFALSLAPVFGGSPVHVGNLRLEQPLTAEEEHGLKFNPAHCGGGIEPATWLNRLRPDSYRASQSARPLETPRGSSPEQRGEAAAEPVKGRS
jgi:hypothetical protein